MPPRRRRTLFSCIALLLLAAQGAMAHPCRVDGIPNELQCGFVKRPLDPARPAGVQI